MTIFGDFLRWLWWRSGVPCWWQGRHNTVLFWRDGKKYSVCLSCQATERVWP